MSRPAWIQESPGPLSISEPVVLAGGALDCAQVHAIAHGAPVRVDLSALQRMSTMPPGPPGVLAAKRKWMVGEEGGADPGLARMFILSHCAGVGPLLPSPVVRGAMAARAQVLLAGHSGVRPDVVEVLVDMLNAGVHPLVPSQGSVGAAGDLAPMAHIARVVCGFTGPLPVPTLTDPTHKEALALINGVSLTASLAALAVVRARRVYEAGIMACAMSFEAVGVESGCLDGRALSARGHGGVAEVGARLRSILAGSQRVVRGGSPAAFSLRCAPQVLGALAQALDYVEGIVAAELGGISDNPLYFPEDPSEPPSDQDWVEAGNFHGASVGLAMDHLKAALTQAATASERRTFRLTDGDLTPGLPSFLVPGTGLNSGFMIAQYTAASLASECKGLSHPANVDSIPTVQHHEDHVSMGPIAARGALSVIECVADIVGIEALLAAQAFDLLADGHHLPPALHRAHAEVRGVCGFWSDDGILHPELAAAGRLVRSGALGGERAKPW